MSELFELDKDILEKFKKKFGNMEQLCQTMGECGELIAACQNHRRILERKKDDLDTHESMLNILQESVDVYFMIQQIRYMAPAAFDYLCTQKIKCLNVLEKEDGNVSF
jgi:hypothetical protein